MGSPLSSFRIYGLPRDREGVRCEDENLSEPASRRLINYLNDIQIKSYECMEFPFQKKNTTF